MRAPSGGSPCCRNQAPDQFEHSFGAGECEAVDDLGRPVDEAPDRVVQGACPPSPDREG